MTIDIPTAAFFSILMHVILFVILLVYARVAKQHNGVFHWALWNILFACGMVIWVLRGPLPLWFSIVFGNSLMVFAGCFVYLGTVRFVRNQAGTRWVFVLPALTFLLYSYFMLYQDSVILRREVVSFVGATIFLATAYQILRMPGRPLTASYRFTGGIFVIYGMALILRAFFVFFKSPQPSPFAPSFEQSLFFILSPVFSLLITVGFGLMIIQRLFAELQLTATALEQEHSQTKIMLENLAAGVVACNQEGQFTIINQAAREYHNWPLEASSLEQIHESHPLYQPDGETSLKKEERPLYRALQGEQVRDVECVLKSLQREARHFLVNASPLVNASGQGWGAIAVFTDITERKQGAQAQARLLAELQQAMKEIKSLRGLIPICAHCKNVRDDAGFWQQVEDYLQQRTEVEFSHGICPACFEKHFGDFMRSRSQ